MLTSEILEKKSQLRLIKTYFSKQIGISSHKIISYFVEKKNANR